MTLAACQMIVQECQAENVVWTMAHLSFLIMGIEMLLKRNLHAKTGNKRRLF